LKGKGGSSEEGETEPKLSAEGKRESRIVEGHICPDHLHMLIEIPPKHAVAHVIGIYQGEIISIARTYMGRKQKNFTAFIWLATLTARYMLYSML
jgi:REP element-mobilizing transposase RayT